MQGLVAGQALFLQVDVGGKRMARPYTPVSMLHQVRFVGVDLRPNGCNPPPTAEGFF